MLHNKNKNNMKQTTSVKVFPMKRNEISVNNNYNNNHHHPFNVGVHQQNHHQQKASGSGGGSSSSGTRAKTAATDGNGNGKIAGSFEPIQKALGFPLVLAQCFALLPVCGVLGPDVRSLRFEWKSFRTFYCLISILITGFVVFTSVLRLAKYGLYFFRFVDVIFYGSSLVCSILFLQLARNWPTLMRDWLSVELAMRSYGYPRNLQAKLKFTTVAVMGMALVEHSLGFFNTFHIALNCAGDNEEIMKVYFQLSYAQIFSFLPYHILIGFVMQFNNFLCAFTWNFSNLLIILMSIAMALRFKQITSKLSHDVGTKIENERYWKQVREDYNRLCRLCRSLDDAMSYITLVVFATNLFFILVQLFHSLKPIKGLIGKLYFYFSFGFLIFRTIVVSLYAAWINDESKEPTAILNSVPSHVYNLEIRRFLQQISFDAVALTGRNFFRVTRGLILSIAGAIVTYELVLIQFNENAVEVDNVTNITSNASLCK